MKLFKELQQISWFVVFTDFYLFDGLQLDVNCIWFLVVHTNINLK